MRYGIFDVQGADCLGFDWVTLNPKWCTSARGKQHCMATDAKQWLCTRIRGVHITFHQSLLNSNVTAITANLLLGLRNKVI